MPKPATTAIVVSEGSEDFTRDSMSSKLLNVLFLIITVVLDGVILFSL